MDDIKSEKYTLMYGDCVDRMIDMESNIIDLTVTSPPYDNLRTYDDSLDWNFDIFKCVADELYRITKMGGVVVWVVGDATIKGSETGTSFRQALYFKDIGFNLHDTMIYQKSGCSLPSPNRYLQCFEYMFVFSKGKPKTYNFINDRKNKFERWGKTKKVRERDGSFTIRETKPFQEYGRRYNVWQYTSGGQGNTSSDDIAHKHPAIFPEKLANDHICSWSNVGDLVFDPFMGSATTGKMSIINNRNFIGIEKVGVYFELSRDRMIHAQNIASIEST